MARAVGAVLSTKYLQKDASPLREVYVMRVIHQCIRV